MEAIASRFEAIASRLEAIATRVHSCHALYGRSRHFKCKLSPNLRTLNMQTLSVDRECLNNVQNANASKYVISLNNKRPGQMPGTIYLNQLKLAPNLVFSPLPYDGGHG